VKSIELIEAKTSIIGKYKNSVIAGIDFDRIYAGF